MPLDARCGRPRDGRAWGRDLDKNANLLRSQACRRAGKRLGDRFEERVAFALRCRASGVAQRATAVHGGSRLAASPRVDAVAGGRRAAVGLRRRARLRRARRAEGFRSGARLLGRAAAGAHRRHIGSERRGATAEPRAGCAGTVVADVRVARARRTDPLGARAQPDARFGAGRAAPGAGALRGRRWRTALPAGQRQARRVPGQVLGRHQPARRRHLQSVQRIGRRLLHVRPLRRDAAPTRSLAGAGRLPGLPGHGDLLEPEREHRHDGDPGGVAARAVAGDARDHRLAVARARDRAQAGRARRDRAAASPRPADATGADAGDRSGAREGARPDAPPTRAARRAAAG